MSAIDRREFLATVTAGVTAQRCQPATQCWQRRPLVVRRPLRRRLQARSPPPPSRRCPSGSIRPAGWLQRQLRIQADGLSGHLDEFWPDVAQSQWFGGTAEGWERAPYWLDGAIPLAWSLGDEPLQARIRRYVTHIVEHQRADGWFGPYPEDAVAKRYDMWAILLVNKVLAQYHDATGDARVLSAMTKSLRAMQQGLDRTPLYNWGKFRWFEGLIPVYHAFERTREPWLLDLARKLREQGVDYEALYSTDGHHGAHAAARSLEVDQARRQHRDGDEGRGARRGGSTSGRATGRSRGA